MLKTWPMEQVLGRSFFEETHVWPLWLVLPGGAGFTLWGDALWGDDDIVLAAANRLVLGATRESLVEFVLAEPNVNFRGRRGYVQLQAALSDGGRFDPEATTVSAVAMVPAWMREAPQNWSRTEMSDAIDALNMVWDIAHTIDDAATVAALTRNGGALGVFLDALYDAGGILDKPSDVNFVDDFELPGLAGELDVVLARIEDRTHRR